MIGLLERGKLGTYKNKSLQARWTGKPDKTGITVLNPSESRGIVPMKR